MQILKSIKTQLVIFLFCFALFLAFKDKDGAFLLNVFTAAASAVVIESFFRLLKEKALTFSASSLITGLILGFVLSGDNHWWVIVAAAAFAILSKHTIRFNKRHIFNPAALGILAAVIIFGASTQWKGTYLWYVLVPFGVYFSWKIRKIGLLTGYFLVSLALFSISALMQKEPLGNVFGYFSYFYIFVMAIEPKTTPGNRLGKIIFGIGLAVCVFILNTVGIKFDAELAGLLAMNILTQPLNKLR